MLFGQSKIRAFFRIEKYGMKQVLQLDVNEVKKKSQKSPWQTESWYANKICCLLQKYEYKSCTQTELKGPLIPVKLEDKPEKKEWNQL